MPTKLKTRCRQPGCPELTDKGYCEKHRKQVNQTYRLMRPDKAEQEIYASNRWKTISKRFKEQNPLCCVCARKGKISPSEVTHHIKPIREGGEPWSMENIEAVCKSCHAKIHNRE